MLSRLPTFFIIGAAKAGTTSLASLLESHPQAGVVQGKEPHFFSASPSIFRSGWVRYQTLFDHCGGKLAVGDASTSYSRIRYHPNVIDRIWRYVPNAKIIYMVRHPLNRMESAYTEHLCTAGGQTFASINDAVSKQPMIIDSSRYWEVFSAYRSRFSESQIKVVWFEDYIRAQIVEFQSVCRFLEIDDSVAPDLSTERTNSRSLSSERMARAGRPGIQIDTTWTEETRYRAVLEIRDDARRLLTHFGRPLNYWEGI
jgi:hypothetical protein